MYQYKTVVYKEGTLNTVGSKNVNITKFTKLINHYAQAGWRLKIIEKDQQKAFFGGKREAYLLIFEKRVA